MAFISGKIDVGARHFRDAHGVAHMPKFHVCENDKSVPSAAKRCSFPKHWLGSTSMKKCRWNLILLAGI